MRRRDGAKRPLTQRPYYATMRALCYGGAARYAVAWYCSYTLPALDTRFRRAAADFDCPVLARGAQDIQRYTRERSHAKALRRRDMAAFALFCERALLLLWLCRPRVYALPMPCYMRVIARPRALLRAPCFGDAVAARATLCVERVFFFFARASFRVVCCCHVASMMLIRYFRRVAKVSAAR